MKEKPRRCNNTKINKCLIEDDEYFYRDNEMARAVIKSNVSSKLNKK